MAREKQNLGIDSICADIAALAMVGANVRESPDTMLDTLQLESWDYIYFVMSIPPSSSSPGPSPFPFVFWLLVKLFLGPDLLVVGLSTPFVIGGGLLLCTPSVLSFASPFFSGLSGGQELAGVLLIPEPGNLQNGAGLLSGMWLVGSLAVFGAGTVRLYGLGAGVWIG